MAPPSLRPRSSSSRPVAARARKAERRFGADGRRPVPGALPDARRRRGGADVGARPPIFPPALPDAPRARSGQRARLVTLTEALGLTPFDAALLVVAIAPTPISATSASARSSRTTSCAAPVARPGAGAPVLDRRRRSSNADAMSRPAPRSCAWGRSSRRPGAAAAPCSLEARPRRAPPAAFSWVRRGLIRRSLLLLPPRPADAFATLPAPDRTRLARAVRDVAGSATPLRLYFHGGTGACGQSKLLARGGARRPRLELPICARALSTVNGATRSSRRCLVAAVAYIAALYSVCARSGRRNGAGLVAAVARTHGSVILSVAS